MELGEGTWFVPEAKTKEKQSDLTVYLSPFALAQFQRLHAITGKTCWRFLPIHHHLYARCLVASATLRAMIQHEASHGQQRYGATSGADTAGS
ncbi:hypothetical protein [Pelomonas sp. KK5]|uniref:hypothetical protein n=1 Tax=Pelomonas sp. KK5 TaxID=1855730 RepID=UPI001301ED29|nr:hypothetical protein [Pelomonas sp. KK5]